MPVIVVFGAPCRPSGERGGEEVDVAAASCRAHLEGVRAVAEAL